MNIQKHCIRNVEGSRQGKKIYLIFTDGYKHPQIQNGREKNKQGNDNHRSKKQKASLENRVYARYQNYKNLLPVTFRYSSTENESGVNSLR